MMRSISKFRYVKLIAFISIVFCGLSVFVQAAGAMKVQANRVVEVALISGKTYKNPFVEIELNAVVTQPDSNKLRVPMFWAGGNRWCLRYASSIAGVHTFRTECSDNTNAKLHGVEGEIEVMTCTGGADVVGMLNLPRLRGEETQPGSILFKLDMANNPGRPNGPGSGLLDSLYIHGADSSNSRTVTAANLKGRKAVLNKVRTTKKRLMHLQPEAGFRENYRIQGETVITVDDYASGRVFDDAVCYAFYPVDLHTRSGVKPKALARGTVPTVPLSALVPKGSRNIIVAGRCVSSDRLANSGLRVQASCMAMGQAADVAAALATEHGTTPLELPLTVIHRHLRAHGAIIPA